MSITPEIIIESRSKNSGPILFADYKKWRAHVYSPKGGKKSSTVTGFIPLLFLMPDGHTKTKLVINVQRQLIAKAANVNDQNVTPKYMQFSISHIKPEYLGMSETYKADTHASLLATNATTMKALGIIADEYERLADEVTEMTETTKAAAIPKNNEKSFAILSSHVGKGITKFRQTSFKAEDGSGSTPMEHPIFRIKIPLTEINGVNMIGYNIKRDGGQSFEPIIYDLAATCKAMTSATTKDKCVRATVKVSDKPTFLNIANAKFFLNNLSMLNGQISIGEICVSSVGISCLVKLVGQNFVVPNVSSRSPGGDSYSKVMAAFGDLNQDAITEVTADEEPQIEPVDEPKPAKSQKQPFKPTRAPKIPEPKITEPKITEPESDNDEDDNDEDADDE